MSVSTVFLSQGFRPFFLLSAAFAAIAVPFWLILFLTGQEGGLALPMDWHIHEMLFGYLGGALAGFLLTAVPNWTGRQKIGSAALAGLAVLWVVGRGSFFFLEGYSFHIFLSPLFLVCLGVYVGIQVTMSGNKRNFVVVGLILLLAVADLVFMTGQTELGIRLGFSVAVMMIGLIGGRVTPAFTRNWMVAHKLGPLPSPVGGFDKIVLAVTTVCLAMWVARPELAGLLILPGTMHLMRLARWRGFSVSEPLIVMLHIAYLWVPVGLILLGLGGVFPDFVPQSSGLHGIGAGAVSLMTMIVMMRAILGHSNLPLVSDGLINSAFGLVYFGAILRVTAALLYSSGPVLHAAAFFWSLGFVLFLIRFTPLFFRAAKK